MGEVIGWLAILALVWICVRDIRGNLKNGSCGGCTGCTGGSCTSCSAHAKGGKIMFKMTLEIDGMACNMCEAHVNEAIRKAFPVKKVTSSYKKKRTEILSEHILHETELREALDPTGYRLVSVHAEPYQKKGWKLI